MGAVYSDNVERDIALFLAQRDAALKAAAERGLKQEIEDRRLRGQLEHENHNLMPWTEES